MNNSTLLTDFHCGPYSCRQTIEEMWNGLESQSPALLPQFESFIELLSKQIRVNQNEADLVDSAGEQTAANRNRILQKLRQAIEFRLLQERQQVIRHAQKHLNVLHSQLGIELHNKQSRIMALDSEQSGLMARLREMKHNFQPAHIRVISNQDDHNELLHEATSATQHDIAKISSIDAEVWVASAISIDNAVAVERESLIRQLEILNELNVKLDAAHEGDSATRDAVKGTKRDDWEAIRRRLIDEVPSSKKMDGVGTRLGFPKPRSFSDPRLQTTVVFSVESERTEEKTRRRLSVGDESKDLEQHQRRMLSIYESEKSFHHHLDVFGADHRRRSRVGSEVDLHQPQPMNLLTGGHRWRSAREEREIKDAADVELLTSSFREDGDVQLLVPAYFNSAKKPPVDLAAQPKLVDACVATEEGDNERSHDAEATAAVSNHVLQNREQIHHSITNITLCNAGMDADGDESVEIDSTTTVGQRQNTDRFYKIILLGDCNVGKTTLIYRIATGMFKSGFKATVGVDFITRHFELPESAVDATSNSVLKQNFQPNRTEKFVPIGVQFWDTAGMERYRAISRQYFKKSDGAILLYDVTSSSSFVNLRGWLEMLQDSTDDAALDNVTILLCGSKVDLVDADPSLRAVPTQKAKQLAEPYGAMHAEISARSGTNVDEAIYNLLCEIKRKDDKRIRDAADGNFTIGNLNNKKTKNCCG